MMMREPAVKEWIEPMLETWAAQVRRSWQGDDGWPPRTVLSRIKEEGVGASQGRLTQRVFEVYGGDGLLVRRAIEGMPYHLRQVLALHWLANGNAEEKCQALKISKARYWVMLDVAYHYIAGHIGAVTQ